MIWYRRTWFNIILTLLVTLLCLGFQSSFWFQLTGGSPSPQLWLNIILYMILFRPPKQAFFMSYLIGWIATAFSSASLGVTLPALLITVAIGVFLKSRFFWVSTRYFIAASLSMTLTYQLTGSAVSYFFETNPMPIYSVARFLELILTPLFAAPIYWTLAILDRWMEPTLLTDSVGGDE